MGTPSIDSDYSPLLGATPEDIDLDVCILRGSRSLGWALVCSLVVAAETAGLIAVGFTWAAPLLLCSILYLTVIHSLKTGRVTRLRNLIVVLGMLHLALLSIALYAFFYINDGAPSWELSQDRCSRIQVISLSYVLVSLLSTQILNYNAWRVITHLSKSPEMKNQIVQRLRFRII